MLRMLGLVLCLVGFASAAHAADCPNGGRLLIKTQPEGAEVWLDGQKLGLAPVVTPPLCPSKHELRIEAVGHDPKQETVEVGMDGGMQTWSVILNPLYDLAADYAIYQRIVERLDKAALETFFQERQARLPLWQERAAQGDARVQLWLGSVHANGRMGVAKDEAEAVRWYRKAAEQGNTPAQMQLGMAYINGKGIAKDAAEGVRWLRKAAEQGNALAQLALGGTYINGEGIAKDAAEGVRWLRKAAEQGNALAQLALGEVYVNGEGIAKDAAEGVRWIRKAAEQGNALAQIKLVFAYIGGEGVARDMAEANRWIRKAAEQSEDKEIQMKAQWVMGMVYEKGMGVAKDKAEAVRWYRKAAEQGNEDAKEALKRLE